MWISAETLIKAVFASGYKETARTGDLSPAFMQSLTRLLFNLDRESTSICAGKVKINFNISHSCSACQARQSPWNISPRSSHSPSRSLPLRQVFTLRPVDGPFPRDAARRKRPALGRVVSMFRGTARSMMFWMLDVAMGFRGMIRMVSIML